MPSLAAAGFCSCANMSRWWRNHWSVAGSCGMLYASPCPAVQLPRARSMLGSCCLQPGCVLHICCVWPHPCSHVAAGFPRARLAGAAEPWALRGAALRGRVPAAPGVLHTSPSPAGARAPPRLRGFRALDLLQQSWFINHPVIPRLSEGKSKKPQACTGVPKESNCFVKLSEVQWGSFCSFPPQTLNITAVPEMM